MAIRQFDVNVSLETSTIPSITTPSATNDIMTIGYANSNFAKLTFTSKNYISNGDAEVDTTGWAAYADAAAATPADGTGGAPTVTITRVTTSPLADAGMFRITKDAANRQGEGASYDFTIETADIAKTHVINFDYTTGGTFTTGASSDLQVFLYDRDNAALITLDNATINAATGQFTATFETAASPANDYRLIFHVATTSASAWTFDMDRVVCAPFRPTMARNEVRVHTGNGHGSTDTKIRRFTTKDIDVGTAITHATSAANGDTFTLNRSGIYAVTYTDAGSASAFFGVSVDSSELTTNVQSITVADLLGLDANVAGLSCVFNAIFYAASGSVVRAHTAGGVDSVDDQQSNFRITLIQEMDF